MIYNIRWDHKVSKRFTKNYSIDFLLRVRKVAGLRATRFISRVLDSTVTNIGLSSHACHRDYRHLPQRSDSTITWLLKNKTKRSVDPNIWTQFQFNYLRWRSLGSTLLANDSIRRLLLETIYFVRIQPSIWLNKLIKISFSTEL